MNAVRRAPIARFVDDIQRIGGLKGTDIANIMEVSKATVSRWRKSTSTPHAREQLMLSNLYYIVTRLEEYYNAPEIRVWLHARHPQLDGRRAIDVIHDDQAEEVLRILDRLDAAVYL